MLLTKITIASITSWGLLLGTATNSTLAQIHDSHSEQLSRRKTSFKG